MSTKPERELDATTLAGRAEREINATVSFARHRPVLFVLVLIVAGSCTFWIRGLYDEIARLGTVITELDVTVRLKNGEISQARQRTQEAMAKARDEEARTREEAAKARHFEGMLAPFLAVAKSKYPDVPSEAALKELLKPINAVLSEAFRYDLTPDTVEGNAAQFAASKFFLEDPDFPPQGIEYHYHRLASKATKAFSSAIPQLARSPSFKAYLESQGVKVEVMSFDERVKRGIPWPYTGQVLAAANGGILENVSDPKLHYILFPNLTLYIDGRVLRALEKVHFEFQKVYTESMRDVIHASRASANFSTQDETVASPPAPSGK